MTTRDAVRPSTTDADTEVLVDPTMRERGRRFERAVREAMAQQGINSMRELADETGTPTTTWYRWFKGYVPRRSSLVRSAYVLDVTVDQLMDPWENGPRVITMTDEQFDAALSRAAEKVAALVVERLSQGQAQTPPQPPLEAQQEVAEAERALAARLDSERQPRSADQPHAGEGSSGPPRPRE